MISKKSSGNDRNRKNLGSAEFAKKIRLLIFHPEFLLSSIFSALASVAELVETSVGLCRIELKAHRDLKY